MFLTLYLLIGLLCLGITTYLNFEYKWITKHDIQDDGGLTAVVIIAATIGWPITLIIIGTRMAWKYISENAFPDRDK